ncbi:hypothetical protein HPB50_002722 [Hyalomma asiaticum]|uniref:Uncharacterized protein n=1 Tax=Hyalomma asiaticum TaxID=266040 RepID=A0ACB7SBR9_HYAAI|nr:hypothetical protein HPB50_002722 [Hyalomma asiaticum]
MDDPSLLGGMGGSSGGDAGDKAGDTGGAGASAFGFNPLDMLCSTILAMCSCCFVCVFIVIFIIMSLLGLITFAKPTPADTVFEKWATVCDAPHCAEVAKEIFSKNGAIGDAAVATLLCMGVTAPHLTGIGGGLMAVLYDKSTMKIQALDALGVSPKSVAPDKFSTNASALKLGANAPIVPGALAGMKALHTKVGKLPWKDVFQPAIRLAKQGFTVGPHLAAALANHENVINVSASLSWSTIWSCYASHRLNGGQSIHRETLFTNLYILVSNCAIVLHAGFAKAILSVIAASCGSLKKDDLSGYQPQWLDPVSSKIGGSQYIHSVPIPGAGVVLAVAVHAITVQKRNERKEAASSPVATRVSRLLILTAFVEALKFALAIRPELGDSGDVKAYAPEEDLGGAHLTIVAPSGDAVSITSGLNGMFGSGFETSSGLLLNNYMDAFAKPGKQFNLDPSPANQLVPAKRPMTSMVPSIVTKSSLPSPLVGVFGGSGGLPAISAVAQASLLRKLGDVVTEKTIGSSATGIVVTKTGSLLAPNDTRHVDGSRSGA